MNRAVIVAIAGVCVAVTALAGDLNPPAGPVASTRGPEPRTAVNAINTPGDSDSLFKIAQPGSYYLTGNITGVAAKHGVEIAASGVTLDLNGFDLAGVGGSLDGVILSTNASNVVVTNGSVRGWTRGIDLVSSPPVTASGCRVERVTASNNALWGIDVNQQSMVIDCSAMDNGGGIYVRQDCAIINCTVSRSTNAALGPALLVGAGGTITGCTSSSNSSVGMSAGWGSSVTNCVARNNTLHGIAVAGHCAISCCAAYENDSTGIFGGANSTITDCVAHFNSSGISAETGATISGCTAQSSTSSSGISVGAGSAVIDCTSSLNVGDGIVASSNCQIRGNTCDGNGVNPGTGAGINLTGNLNRVEANMCTNADFGVFVAGTRNVIIRNTCGGNINNWNVASGNYLLVINPSTTTAVSGNTGGVSIAADPNANVSY